MLNVMACSKDGESKYAPSIVGKWGHRVDGGCFAPIEFSKDNTFTAQHPMNSDIIDGKYKVVGDMVTLSYTHKDIEYAQVLKFADKKKQHHPKKGERLLLVRVESNGERLSVFDAVSNDDKSMYKCK